MLLALEQRPARDPAGQIAKAAGDGGIDAAVNGVGDLVAEYELTIRRIAILLGHVFKNSLGLVELVEDVAAVVTQVADEGQPRERVVPGVARQERARAPLDRVARVLCPQRVLDQDGRIRHLEVLPVRPFFRQIDDRRNRDDVVEDIPPTHRQLFLMGPAVRRGKREAEVVAQPMVQVEAHVEPLDAVVVHERAALEVPVHRDEEIRGRAVVAHVELVRREQPGPHQRSDVVVDLTRPWIVHDPVRLDGPRRAAVWHRVARRIGER